MQQSGGGVAVVHFNNRLKAELLQCGVEARTDYPVGTPTSTFPAEYANEATADVDALLVLNDGDNKIQKVAEVLMGEVRGGTRNYHAALFDRKTMSKVWGAQISVTGGTPLQHYKATEKADNFGRDLVGYLAADGVIPPCPKSSK